MKPVLVVLDTEHLHRVIARSMARDDSEVLAIVELLEETAPLLRPRPIELQPLPVISRGNRHERRAQKAQRRRHT